MDKLTALLAGLLFGAGITVSGMVNPMKVQNFLDLSGDWDPTLLFVMAAALAVTYAGYQLVLKAPRPRFALAFILPSLQGIDERLIGGAVVFGLGWGLTGFCPGPPSHRWSSAIGRRRCSCCPWLRAWQSPATCFWAPTSLRPTARPSSPGRC